MPSLVDTHIVELARVRELVARAVGAAWDTLPGLDEEDVLRFLELALPVVQGGQIQTARLTDAYLARALERQPIGIPTAEVAGAAVRAGATPAEVYRRPFVTVWTALQNGQPWEQAAAAGRARAIGTARMDMQLTNRATFDAVQHADPSIRGYRRVPDGGACAFCRKVAGAFVKSASAMPLHNGCGCGLEPVLEREHVTPTPEGVAIREHGELGPVLTDPAHDFTSAADLAA